MSRWIGLLELWLRLVSANGGREGERGEGRKTRSGRVIVEKELENGNGRSEVP